MKIVKNASGKTTIKMSRKEWTEMGKKAGWTDKKYVCPDCDSRNVSESVGGWRDCPDCGWKETSSSILREVKEDDSVAELWDAKNSEQTTSYQLLKHELEKLYTKKQKLNAKISELEKALGKGKQQPQG